MKTIKLELGKLPPLTAAQIAELNALSNLSDAQIDYSDIPPLSDVAWAHAVRGQFYKAVKTPLTVRMDADILAWLKSHGKGYQTRMNTILREAMLKQLKQTH